MKSVPACNSHSRPGCKKAKTASPGGVPLPEDMTHYQDNRSQNDDYITTPRSNGLAQKKSKSVPACNSSTRPDCKKDAKTAAPGGVSLPEDMTHHRDTHDFLYPNKDFGYRA